MNKLRKHVRLEEFINGKLFYGIKTGYNKAFVINEKTRSELISKDSRSEEVIKPWLRGRDVNRWHVGFAELYVIFMPHGIEIEKHPAIKAYLSQFRDKLENRATSHLHPWYEMQQPQMGCYLEFEKPKIVYPDIAKKPAFAYDESGAYITNTLYVIPTLQKHLLGILNSNVINFFYSQISSQVRGDYLRFIATYVSQIPIPPINEDQQAEMETLAQQLLDTKGQGPQAAAWEQALNQIVYHLYDLTPAEIALIEQG